MSVFRESYYTTAFPLKKGQNPDDRRAAAFWAAALGCSPQSLCRTRVKTKSLSGGIGRASSLPLPPAWPGQRPKNRLIKPSAQRACRPLLRSDGCTGWKRRDCGGMCGVKRELYKIAAVPAEPHLFSHCRILSARRLQKVRRRPIPLNTAPLSHCSSSCGFPIPSQTAHRCQCSKPFRWPASQRILARIAQMIPFKAGRFLRIVAAGVVSGPDRRRADGIFSSGDCPAPVEKRIRFRSLFHFSSFLSSPL